MRSFKSNLKRSQKTLQQSKQAIHKSKTEFIRTDNLIEEEIEKFEKGTQYDIIQKQQEKIDEQQKQLEDEKREQLNESVVKQSTKNIKDITIKNLV